MFMEPKLKNLIEKSKNIVFFGGAGVSTESGIPDFRSEGGIYSRVYEYPPEVILSHTFFCSKTEDFFSFYRERMLFLDAQPNKAHYALAELEKAGKLKAVITQNIDNLHQKAGSKTVFELHGNVYRNYCTLCNKFFPIGAITATTGVPHCDCGGIIKPDVVLYEEQLDDRTLYCSVEALRRADLLIIGGTSLKVYPAAGLIDYYGGDNIVEINKTPTAADSRATLIYNSPIGEILG